MKKWFIIIFIMFFSLTGCTRVNLNEYKENKIKELEEYTEQKIIEVNYSNDFMDKLKDAVIQGKTDIVSASTKREVITQFNKAKDFVDFLVKNIKGVFYSIQDAYDEGMLTTDQLRSIAHYQSSGENEPDHIPIPMNPEVLSNSTIKSISKTYLAKLKLATKEDGTLMYPNATIEDIIISGYYGTYSEAIAIKISDNFSGCPGVVLEFVVGGVTFTYSGTPVVIWKSL